MNAASAIAGLFHLDFESILADPARLGIFLQFAETIAELEPRAREAAIKLAFAAQEIPGWRVVRKEGNRFVETVHVRELLQGCPAEHLQALLEVIAKMLGNISETRWQTLCNAIERLDADKAISQCGTTAFLRKQGNQGTNNNKQERKE